MNIFQKKPNLKIRRGIDFLNPEDKIAPKPKERPKSDTVTKTKKTKTWEGLSFFNSNKIKKIKKGEIRKSQLPTTEPGIKKSKKSVVKKHKKDILKKLLKIKKKSDKKRIGKNKEKITKFKISSFLSANNKNNKVKKVVNTGKNKPAIKIKKKNKTKKVFNFLQGKDWNKKIKTDKARKKEKIENRVTTIKKKIRDEDMKNISTKKISETTKKDTKYAIKKLFLSLKSTKKQETLDKKEKSIIAYDKKSVRNGKKPLIETKNLSVTYNLGKTNELSALKNSNIKIYDGEYIVFFGPSGCGKSTLLFAIAGLQSATNGEVIIDGLNISNIKKKSKKMVDFHRKKIGIIFQSFHLIPSLNVARNIGLPQIFDNRSKKKRVEKTKELMSRFGILSEAKKLPSQLSGGQQQRVAIARSLINDPKILLADEPVGNLDTKSAENVLSILRNLNEEEKRTIILVTHDARHLNFANRVFHMKDGAIVKETINKDIRPEAIKLKEEPTKPVVSKDLELLMRTYSELSSSQLGSMLIPFKAKQLVQDVLTEVSTEQVKIMEKVVEEYLMNIHTGDYKMIKKTLDQEMERGGADLDSRTAEKLTEKIKQVLEEVKNLKKVEKKSIEYKTSTSHEKIQHLRKFILDKYKINIRKEIAIKRLDQALEMRLNDEMDGVKMRKLLDKRISSGGAGIDKRNAKKIAKEMELIMLLRYK